MKTFIRIFISIICVLFILYIYARLIEPKWLDVNTQIINSKYVSDDLKKIKIVQFSDTHLSNYYTLKDLEKTVEKINSLNADIVVFSGDLIDNYKKSTFDKTEISHVLSKIEASLGKFSVYGNHDYGGGATTAYKDIMEMADFQILINESIYFEEYNLTVTGIDDALFGEPHFYSINQYFMDDAYNILLCHEPDVIKYIENYNFDLTISGHSHGEQINLPFMDDYILPQLAKSYVRGLYELDTDRSGKIYVNKGIGTSKIPLRFRARPEITEYIFTNN